MTQAFFHFPPNVELAPRTAKEEQYYQQLEAQRQKELARQAWDLAYSEFDARHKAQFGFGINRPWTDDAQDAKAAVDSRMREVYEQLGGTDATLLAPYSGADKQPNSYTPRPSDDGGFFGGLGDFVGGVVGGVGDLIGGAVDTVGDAYMAVRDPLQAAAVVVGNYFVPGSSIITSRLVSDDAKAMLNTDLGKIAQIGSGIAGGINSPASGTSGLGAAGETAALPASQVAALTPAATTSGGLNLAASLGISNPIAAAAVNNAALSSGLTALQGGQLSDVLKAGATGAVVGGALAGPLSGPLNSLSKSLLESLPNGIPPELAKALVNAGTSGAIAGVTGGDVGNALVKSGLMSAYDYATSTGQPAPTATAGTRDPLLTSGPLEGLRQSDLASEGGDLNQYLSDSLYELPTGTTEGLRPGNINTTSTPGWSAAPVDYSLGTDLAPSGTGLTYPTLGGSGTGITVPSASSVQPIVNSLIPTDPRVTDGVYTPGTTVSPNKGTNLGDLAKLATTVLPLVNALSKPDTTTGTTALTRDAAQEARDTTPVGKWDWNRIKSEASTAGMDPNSFVARNWDKISTGQYNMADGGLTRLAQGAGSGRADTIDARLSDGEYVMDAETVALLGDGSTTAGASVLDKLRENIRRHKGRALVAGKISPNAKSPLSYLGGI
jgi:hypothetical protein